MDNETLHRTFEYVPELGTLRRIHGGVKEFPWRGIGKNRRYLACTVGGRTYYLHRLIWQYHHGEVPKMIDHKDMDTRNNRIENLRLCTPSSNQLNSRKRGHNTSGFKGVFSTRGRKAEPWFARITVDGVHHQLGYFYDPAEAHEAYKEAADRLAKEFARHA